MHLQENTFFDLDQGHMKCCPVSSATFLGIKFEVARSKGFGEDTFTRNMRTQAQTDDRPTLVRN